MMGSGRKTLIGTFVLLGLAVAGVAIYLNPIAPIATGYAAKLTCSGVFLSGRTAADVGDDLPDNPLVPFLRTAVDVSAGTVRTSLLGLWPSTAYLGDGTGCTLAESDPRLPAVPDVAVSDPDAPWPVGSRGPVADPPDVDGEGLSAAIDGAFTEDDPQGRERNTRAVVVAHRGELVAERYAGEDGIGPDTALLGWSMGKSVAGALVGRAVGAGLLAVDDPVGWPGWEGGGRADITVEHLLTMTSGLAFEEVYDPGTDATRMLFTPGDTGDYAADQPLEHPPGSHWSYSSGTANLLCDVVQGSTGHGPELAHDQLFEPLGMTTAVVEADESGGLVCSSFVYASARDWARFGQLYLDDGVWQGERLLPEGWVDASTQPVEESAALGYGYQWWLNGAPDGSLRMPDVPADAFWASGNEGQQVVVVPSEELVVVRLGYSPAFDGVRWGLEPLLAGVIDALE
jgi:CubicO group peptidase (beta-lactamase class C family)